MAYQTHFPATDAFTTILARRNDERRATLAQRIVRGVQDHIRRKRDLKRLLSQPDYLLRDIGVTREQVMAEFARSIF